MVDVLIVVPRNMIVFPDPKMTRAHSGHAVIELTEDGTWEGFPRFAEVFTNELGARKVRHVDGPDVRFWDIELEGIRLNLGYDDFPNGLSLMSYSDDGDRLLQRIFECLKQAADTTKAEQAGAGQPATRPKSKSEGSDKPQPESEGRSR